MLCLHSVITLRLTDVNSVTGETSEGVLNLIDLAGSERLSQSGATRGRLRETQAINKSLSCLSDAIYAIANKDMHIPVPQLEAHVPLQNSLSGNSKTLMYVNISPLLSNLARRCARFGSRPSQLVHDWYCNHTAGYEGDWRREVSP